MNIKTQNEIEQMHDICKPLGKLGISYFNFVRYYQDGTHIKLSNQSVCAKHYHKHQVPDFEGTLLWSNINKHPLFYEIAEFREVDNGTLIVLKFGDVTERYFFGSTQSNGKTNYSYMYHLDLLKRFIFYFKEIAKPLIKQAEKTKVMASSQGIVTAERYILCQNKINEFISQTKFNKICIRVNTQDVYVNLNEAKILTLMKNGYTAKEISLAIGLTRKTVEIYRDKLKIKLDLFSRSGLLSIAHANSLLSLNLLENTDDNSVAAFNK